MSKTKKSKTSVKNKPQAMDFYEKLEALHSFYTLFSNHNRRFTEGDLVVLNGYSVFESQTVYRIAIILKKPSLFARFKTYHVATVNGDGVVRPAIINTEEIICRLEDAPAEFKLD